VRKYIFSDEALVKYKNAIEKVRIDNVVIPEPKSGSKF
jgi:hypothetical protein